MLGFLLGLRIIPCAILQLRLCNLISSSILRPSAQNEALTIEIDAVIGSFSLPRAGGVKISLAQQLRLDRARRY
jgi:hypothetical protein